MYWINSLTHFMMGNFSQIFCCLLIYSFKINFFNLFFQEYRQSVKQFGYRSGLIFCLSWWTTTLQGQTIIAIIAAEKCTLQHSHWIMKRRSRSQKKCLSSRPSKMKKYSRNEYKIVGAHFQCVNKHYAKFEYKGIKSVGVTDYINQTPPKPFGWNKCLSSTPLKNNKIFNQMCTK